MAMLVVVGDPPPPEAMRAALEQARLGKRERTALERLVWEIAGAP